MSKEQKAREYYEKFLKENPIFYNARTQWMQRDYLAGYSECEKDMANWQDEKLKDCADKIAEVTDGVRPMIEKRDAEIQKLRDEIETLRMKLAGCGVAALCNTEESIKSQRIGRDSPCWSASYRDVCNAVDREMRLREALKVAREGLEDFKGFGTRHGTSPTGMLMPCGCFQSFEKDSWQRYIRSQDESVRARARATLKRLDALEGK